MTDSRPLDAERTMLAAEYALGLLEGAERAECERLYASDPAFAQEVDRWVGEAESWNKEQHSPSPSRHFYQRVATAVGVENMERPVETNDNQTASGPGMWRPLALAASLAAVVFAGLWLLDRPTEPDPMIARGEAPALSDQQENFSIAQISSDDATSLVSALYDSDTGTLYVKLSDIPDTERVPQLWLLDSAGTPRSLGFGTRSANTSIALTPEQRQIASEGGTLAISLEQPAAQPHETPSDVLGAAQLAHLDIER